jgi:2-oxoglutarate dehydrogenase E2 component (dihydrolipoamide succinyltransferase)
VISEVLKNTGDIALSEEVLARIDTEAAAPTVAKATGGNGEAPAAATETPAAAEDSGSSALSPAVQRLVDEHGLDPGAIEGTGKGGRLIKGDVLAYLESNKPAQATFNEVDMQPVMELRKRYKDQFEKTHGVRLGFMSFFAKSAVQALERYPAVNAYIEGNDIVYHDYQDIGVAVGSPRGLVVPILRDVAQMSFADIEAKIAEFGAKAKDGTLTVEDMSGGTFTISNGGVFGSLLSTPILNPPQSAILGMHKTQERPMVVDGEIVVRPVMYLALSYDHRIIDGREAVLFLVAIKEAIEDPARLLLGV